MSFNMAGVLIFLSVCGIVASNPDRSVDCRKFVFAPLCRGVAAKRASFNDIMNFEDNESFKPFVKPFQSPMRSLGVKDNESYKLFLKLFQPGMRSLAQQDNEGFKKLVAPFEYAMKSIALQDKESRKTLDPGMRSVVLQDNESACETF